MLILLVGQTAKPTAKSFWKCHILSWLILSRKLPCSILSISPEHAVWTKINDRFDVTDDRKVKIARVGYSYHQFDDKIPTGEIIRDGRQ